jgi:Rod binding domain-containing protein
MNAITPTATAGATAKPADSVDKIRHAASDFEALLLQQMMQSAKMGESDESPDSSSLMELGQQQFAQALASSGGLGIAKMVVLGLTKDASR